MARTNTFTFRVSDQEKQLIDILAQQLERNQSDAIRWLIREAISQLEKQTVLQIDTQGGQYEPSQCN